MDHPHPGPRTANFIVASTGKCLVVTGDDDV